MSESPPPTPKKARPKPKARLAPPTDVSGGSRLNVRASAGPPSRSPSAPASQPHRSRTSSSTTPIVLSSSSPPPENAVGSSSSQARAVVVKPEPVVRRSSRPTASPLKRAESGDNPTWAALNDDADEDEIDDIIEESSSSELSASRQASQAAAKEERDRSQRQREEDQRIARQRQRADDDRFNALFQKKPRPAQPTNGRAAGGSPAKGKGKATEEISIDDDDEDDEDMADLNEPAGSSDSDVDRSARKKKTQTAKVEKKRKLVHDWTTKPAKKAESDSDSDLEIIGSGSSKRVKTNGTKGKNKAQQRERSLSLTPPPEVDEAILRRVNTTVRNALAPEEENPLVRGDHNPEPVSDTDDYDFTVPHSPPPPPPSRGRRAAPPASRRANGQAGPSKSSEVIAIEDSSDEAEVAPVRTAPVRTRNAKTFDAPTEITIKIKIVSHLPDTQASARAKMQFERPQTISKVDRMNTFDQVFSSFAERTGYPLADVVLTMDGKRIFRSTVIDTLNIWAEAEVVGYRKDVYEKVQAEKKTQDQARIASYAAEEAAKAQQEAVPPPGSDDGYSDHGQADVDAGDARAVPSHSPRPAPAQASAPTETKLKLTLRGPHGEAKIQAKPTHTIAKLLNHYGKKHELSPEVILQLKLEDPDGEDMDREAMVKDFEIEDDDMLNVSVG